MEAKCESCGATYLIENQIPSAMKCICNSKSIKIINK